MSFNGAGQTSFMYSKQTCLYIDSKYVYKEPDLFQKKWWDYRFVQDEFSGVFCPMHPMEATHLFFHHYLKSYKFYQQRRKGVNVFYNAPVKSQHLLKNSPATITGIWKARRAADFFGISYDFWCDKCMNFGEIFDKKYLPRPQHLYSSKNPYDPDKISVVEFVRLYWKKTNADRFIKPQNPFFKAENFFDHPDQIKFREILKSRLLGSSNKKVFVASNVYTDKLMSETNVLEALGEEDGREILKSAQLLIN